jgi:ATP/maltotriose-dependent transcriptional regulator MalT
MATQVALKVATRGRRPAGSASIPIVAAKITAPGVPDWALRRPRITKLIAEGRRWCPLTFLNAPAGSGKTMALSLCAHPDPDQFVTELITDDSTLTRYLVDEVLNPQPPAVRDVLLSTSILERVSAEAASELTGNDQARTILPALARANAFVQPTGSGWYRYHTLFAETLRLKLEREHPDRVAPLHRRAALWYERNGRQRGARPAAPASVAG